MILTAEHQVFSDVLIDLGFEPFYEDEHTRNFQRTSAREELERRQRAITVELQKPVIWVTWWGGPDAYGRTPQYLYKFPKHWLDAISRIKELIAIDEHFGRTGERLPGPTDQGTLVAELKSELKSK